jgi:hypothetical protein
MRAESMLAASMLDVSGSVWMGEPDEPGSMVF